MYYKLFSMEKPYTDFVAKIWEKFPQLAKVHDSDNATLPMWNLEQFMKAEYYNFTAERKPLYHLSKLIESYAQQNNEPLIACFEKIARFKFVERRYEKIVTQIPKIWVVADFGKTQFYMSPKTEVLNCGNTELVKVWSVITKGPDGPFGLISEEFEESKFRGFFSFDPNVCRFALQIMEKILDTKFDI